jgi:hypothetical protein
VLYVRRTTPEVMQGREIEDDIDPEIARG